MIQRTIVTALILLLLAPVNAGAAAWMNNSSAANDAATPSMHMAGHDHQAMLDAGHQGAMDETHDHSSGDCDYCMSCSNHCASTALVSIYKDSFALNREFATTISADTLNRVYLLFRPPIRA